LLEILRKLPHPSDQQVLHGPKGGKLKPDTVRNILIRSVLTPLVAAMPDDSEERGMLNGRLHSFRHFFCSMSANANVPEQMLMSWLGHRDSEMIRHYYHLKNDESRQRMDDLPYLLSPDTGGPTETE